MTLSLICGDMVYTILCYLDTKSLCNYDTALLNRKERPYLMSIFSKYVFKNIVACKWSYIRKIIVVNQNCKYNNLSFISPKCKNLTVFSKVCNNRYKAQDISIDNDTVENVHIDFAKCYTLTLNSIKGKNIKKISIVCTTNINNIFYNIRKKCPQLKNIRLIYTDVDPEFIELFKKQNIDIKVTFLKKNE